MKRWMPFEWIAAFRFLIEGRLQTGFILGGIAIGVGVIVFMSVLLTGLQANFIRRVLTSQPHIQITAPDEVAYPLRQRPGQFELAAIQRPTQRVQSIDQWQTILTSMQARPDIVAATPTVTGAALAIRGQSGRSVSISGIEPDAYYKIVRLPDYIVAGTAQMGTDDIVIGTELAKDLGATLGDTLSLSSSTAAARILTIRGIFDLGNKGANERSVFVPLRTAQSLLNLIGGATTIDLTVTDIYQADVIAAEIVAALPIQSDSWIKTNAQFFSAVQAQTISSMLIRVFVGLSVAFGIAAVLVVSVIQRSKDIGILRAMGTRRGQILWIFLIQGGLLGFLGSLLGSLLGTGGVLAFHALARMSDGSEFFPVVIEPSLIVVAAAVATLTGIGAALAPALSAARLDPVEAIRG